MKRIAFLFIMLWLLAMSSAMAWEAAVHAKGVQDICKAFGFSEADATRVGDGAWFDGNDIRIERNEGGKDISFIRNQDRAFNTGVLAEGMPVKTYGKFAISPNDTRYLNSRKYLNKAIRLMKENKRGEALYALGVGLRALQNIFANRDVVNDAAWTTRAKMGNGAGTWMPGMTFDPAWHNVDADDDVFSDAHSDALKASLQATMDVVGEFLTACPQAVENARQPSPSTVDGIVAETVSLLPLREKLAQKVKQTNREIVSQLDKALAAFPMATTAKERETQPPYALTIVPARWLVTIAKVTFRRKLEDMKIDVEEFSGSADAEWKAFEKTTEDLLEALRKTSDELSKALTDTASALKKASPEEGYALARKQLAGLSKAFFTSLKPYCESVKFLNEQLTFWTDVLNRQMYEYAVFHDIALLRIYASLKTQLPKMETAFADFMASSDAAVKEYTGRCDNALADFEQEMASIAEAYGKDADGLKKSAAERVSAARAVFSEKAKQAAESLKGITPLKQGEAVPKAVDDVIKNLMKDASHLKDNVFENLAPSVSDSRRSDGDPQKARRLLAAHATRQDFLRPIDIGSTRPESWQPAVWNDDALVKITYVKRPPSSPIDRLNKMNDINSFLNKLKGTSQEEAKKADSVAENGMTKEVTNQVVADVTADVLGTVAEKGLGALGKAVGTAALSWVPNGAKIGGKIGETGGEFAGHVLSRVIKKVGGETAANAIDDVFGEGTAERFAQNYIATSKQMERSEQIHNTIDTIIALTNPSGVQDLVFNTFQDLEKDLLDEYVVDPLIDKTIDAIFDDDEPAVDINDVTDITKDAEKTMDEFNNKFDLNNPLERPFAMKWLEDKLGGITGEINGMIGGLMDTISSFTMQIKGFMMSIINLAVDLEHIDISDKMDESLQVLTNDLNTMMGKDDQQDKSVKRKATIENKGRDLKRQSTSGSDLKGAPSVKQIEMK